MNDDLYWTPAKLATLVEQVPAPDAADDGTGWSRFSFHVLLDDECAHGVPLPYSARLVGTWPTADGTVPPSTIAQHLFNMMRAYQRAHTEAVGGPDDCMVLYIRRHDGFWELAWTSS